MREKGIAFCLPDGCKPFAGGELLLSDSDAAQLNTRRLSERLRPIWERQKGYEELAKQELNMHLFSDKGAVAVQLRVDIPELETLLENRIKRGVENFFVNLWHAFHGIEVKQIDLLLAGNSCKSIVVRRLFQEYIEKTEQGIERNILLETGQDKDAGKVFRLHLPLGEDEGDSELSYARRLTGKTGVAFGLLDCYRGGNDVKVIEHDFSSEQEAPFRYYLGYIDRDDHFHVNIGRKTGYGDWLPFGKTDYNRFELYYTSEPRALQNNLPANEVHHKKCRIHYLGDGQEGTIYLRKTKPACVEYTVSTAEGIKKEEYLARVEVCELGEV